LVDADQKIDIIADTVLRVMGKNTRGTPHVNGTQRQ
jgi:hypothetical protein